MLWTKGLTHLGLWGDVAVIEPYSMEIVQDEDNSYVGYICRLERVTRKSSLSAVPFQTVTASYDKQDVRKQLERRLAQLLQLKTLAS